MRRSITEKKPNKTLLKKIHVALALTNSIVVFDLGPIPSSCSSFIFGYKNLNFNGKHLKKTKQKRRLNCLALSDFWGNS